MWIVLTNIVLENGWYIILKDRIIHVHVNDIGVNNTHVDQCCFKQLQFWGASWMKMGRHSVDVYSGMYTSLSQIVSCLHT